MTAVVKVTHCCESYYDYTVDGKTYHKYYVQEENKVKYIVWSTEVFKKGDMLNVSVINYMPKYDPEHKVYPKNNIKLRIDGRAAADTK